MTSLNAILRITLSDYVIFSDYDQSYQLQSIQNKFRANEPLTAHWDDKLLEDLTIKKI